MNSERRDRIALLAAVCVTILAIAGWQIYSRFFFASVCQGLEEGASLEELTNFLQEHDPEKLSRDSWHGSFEHTVSGAYGCNYEIHDGKVVSASP